MARLENPQDVVDSVQRFAASGDTSELEQYSHRELRQGMGEVDWYDMPEQQAELQHYITRRQNQYQASTIPGIVLLVVLIAAIAVFNLIPWDYF